MKLETLKNILFQSKISLVGIILTILTYLSLLVFSSRMINDFYYSGFYQWVRSFFDKTTALLPFPSFYLFCFVILSFGFYFIYSYRNSTYKNKIALFIFKLIGFFAWIYLLFYLLWGFNYRVPNLKDKLHIDITEINSELIFKEATKVIKKLNEIRGADEYVQSNLYDSYEYTRTEDNIRLFQKQVLENWKLENSGNVRVRPIHPKGILLRFATAGVFLPFISEGQIDAGLPLVTWPSTIAHEMAHGYGITDEGECNFVSLITCIQSNDLFIRYSGYVMYYRYLASALYYDKTLYQELNALLSDEVKNDLLEIRTELNKYPDIFPAVRNWIYDQFLKSNGVKSGIQSYGTLINLAISYGIE